MSADIDLEAPSLFRGFVGFTIVMGCMGKGGGGAGADAMRVMALSPRQNNPGEKGERRVKWRPNFSPFFSSRDALPPGWSRSAPSHVSNPHFRGTKKNLKNHHKKIKRILKKLKSKRIKKLKMKIFLE